MIEMSCCSLAVIRCNLLSYQSLWVSNCFLSFGLIVRNTKQTNKQTLRVELSLDRLRDFFPFFYFDYHLVWKGKFYFGQ
uniref:Macaca fascicularis brain cDNA, clone: QflA-18709 n=1 Tax=Macaca fascicularis TaxID=9541 RepID=I7GLL3_MACFA|nr:unnamed protein product [Macaca fascicularis]